MDRCCGGISTPLAAISICLRNSSRACVHPGLKFFGYGDELATIIGRKVDFNTAAWLSRYFREQILREAVPVYEQA